MKFDRISLAIWLLLSASANAQDWQPVTGQAALTEIVSDTRLEGTLKGDVTGVARTTVLKGRPWKFQVQYWNYIERGDVFAPEHQIRLSISPGVSAP